MNCVPNHVFVADWSGAGASRVAYHVDVSSKVVTSKRPPSGPWTLQGLLSEAQKLNGKKLVLLDVAIGLPQGLFEAIRSASREYQIRHFLDLIRILPAEAWSGDVSNADHWNIHKPYIRVPGGTGSLRRFKEVAARSGVQLTRTVDDATRGRSPLLLSGIPGTVGTASRDVLRALAKTASGDIAVWPFDGRLESLLESEKVVVGEIYPRALYGHTLLDEDATKRTRMDVGKTRQQARVAALSRLKGLDWPRTCNVVLSPECIESARESEDHFDAYLSALGILRLLLEGVSIEDSDLFESGPDARRLTDPVAEGGMLGVLATQLRRKQRTIVLPFDKGEHAVVKAMAPVVQDACLSQDPGPSIRVTSGSLKYQSEPGRSPNSRQIAFRGLPQGGKESPIHVRIDFLGESYTLTIGDTTSIWAAHQLGTAEDFDALYELITQQPDEWSPITLLEQLAPDPKT